MAKDLYIKAGSGSGGGVPTTRTLTINGTAQDLSADRTWSVGDMLTSTYDTDNSGIVDMAELLPIVVRNSTGSTIAKGKVVYLSGATGNRPNAILAQANSEATSSKTIGVVMADIANNTDGYVAIQGTLETLDTSGFSAGDQLWLSATTAGGMVNTAPAEPNHTVFLGYVARSHPTQGRVVLHIQNGYELDELHGVQITSVANNDILKYNSSTGLWENSNALDAKGYAMCGNMNGATIGLGVTTYIGVGVGTASTIETQRRFVVNGGTVQGVHLRTNAIMTGTLVVTVMKNGSATSMTFTIATGSAAGLYSTTSNQFSVADGDELSIRIQQSTATSASLLGFGVRIH